jgi:hypothetical protein
MGSRSPLNWMRQHSILKVKRDTQTSTSMANDAVSPGGVNDLCGTCGKTEFFRNVPFDCRNSRDPYFR